MIDLKTDRNHSSVALRAAFQLPNELHTSFNGSNNFPSSVKSPLQEGILNPAFDSLGGKPDYNNQGSSMLFNDQGCPITVRDLPLTPSASASRAEIYQRGLGKSQRMTQPEDGKLGGGGGGAAAAAEAKSQANQRDKKKYQHSRSISGLQTMNLKLLTMIKKQMAAFNSSYTAFGKYRNYMNDDVREHINDKSDSYVKSRGNFFLRKFLLLVDLIVLRLDCCLSRIPLLDPDSSLSSLINSLYAGYHTLFFMIFTLVNIYDAPSEYNTLTSQVTFGVWVTEMLIRLNTNISSHENKGLRKSSLRKEIISQYFMTNVIYDIIPLFLLIIQPYQEFKIKSIMQLVIGLKLKNVWIQVGEVQRFLCMAFKEYYLIQLANLIIELFIIGHIIACIWYLVGYLELYYLGEATTWYDEGLADYTWWKLYLQSMYWSLTLMTTGSNTATTVSQLVFTVFIMVFTTIIFGYMLNVIGFILEEMDKKNESKRRDLNLINEYMRSKNTSKPLQKKINIDLEYFYEKNFKKIEEDNQEILEKVSNELNEQLKKEYNREMMKHIPIISNNFSQQAIEELAGVIQEESYFPNQSIYLEEDEQNISLVLIVHGKVEISQGRANKKFKLNTQSTGEVFGEKGFFTGQTTYTQAIAADFTKLIKIRRDKFIEAIKPFDKDIETFHQIKERIALYSNYNDVNHKCVICGQKAHLEVSCPFVHPNRSPWAVKDIFTKSQDAQRIPKIRVGLRVKSLLRQVEIQAQAILFYQHQQREDVGEEEELDEFDYSKNSITASVQSQRNYDEQPYNKLDEITALKVATVSHNYPMKESSQSQFGQIETLYQAQQQPLSAQQKEDTFRVSNEIQIYNNGSLFQSSPKILPQHDRNKYFSEFVGSQVTIFLEHTPENNPQIPSKGPNGFTERLLIAERANDRKQSGMSIFAPTEDENSMHSKRKKKMTTAQKNQTIKIRQTMADKSQALHADNSVILELPGTEMIWDLDKLNDFKYYFTSGNSRNVLSRHYKFHRKNYKGQNKLKKRN